MALRVALHHTTQYHYDHLIGLHPQLVRLRPAPHCRTPIQAYSLHVQPKEHFINWQQDPFGNYLARLVFPEKTRSFRVEVDLVAEMTVINPFDFFLEEQAEDYPFQYEPSLAKELAPYLEVREHGPRLTDWLSGIDHRPQRTVDFLVSLNSRLQHDIGYVIRMEPGVQSCEETLTLGKGSCRDTGWLLVQILRRCGLAARFVSGYLIQLVADQKALDGPSGPSADFADLHAWAEVYVPGGGWLGLDPTSGLWAGEGHIPLACTPDPIGASPISGTTEPCKADFQFDMQLTRVREDPRVTKPYSEEQWQAIDRLGRAVDEVLLAGDVRLTMGGEPTFVSIDEVDADEWNIAAVGPTKRKLASTLLKRLQKHFAPGAVLHYGQGKWYPGEALPRWALSCYWRPDGVPVWQNLALLADEEQPEDNGAEQAERFIRRLAERLGVNPEWAIPGYEDTFYYLWKEGTLPIGSDPFKSDLSDSAERRRLTQILHKGMAAISGYALPLDAQIRDQKGKNGNAHDCVWRSCQWQFRLDRMFLTPGDSPMGYRLPLDSLPAWEEGEEEEGTVEIFRPVLCVEPRDGHLYVFLPPVTHLDAFLDLIACLEETAAELALPIVLEGYPAPRDWRLQRFSVTPDPGVIEINIHPATSWQELVHNTTILYEAARQTRLGTEKFMLDGSHTGTGGGNHMALGGPTPADSPVLRRPDLLRSLLSYWHNHPSLSYMLSGLFVGPTSQAPRVDEARHESLYELEIAFQHMPDGETPAPWLVDRLLRNLLVDLTGNTHRAEFCIDKLYAPESETGRLGLVELRAFEMPPHARMSLVQMLLVRGLVARFWQQPYQHKLVRWGTALHDRFLLPHYVWQDFKDVIEDLQATGYAFDEAWFQPFFEFRFPRYGTISVRDIQLELRAAIEPWNVLGEEMTGSNTARYVDSSVERLQVKVSGLTDTRHQVVCNGRRVPLQPIGPSGEAVAGVRYKAWQPPSGLHPTIRVQAPLVFDLVDTWTGRSLGGCTYHVTHPGGRHYDTFPVNANEAEARRLARFWSYGHTPGPMASVATELSQEFPHTLDLRRSIEC